MMVETTKTRFGEWLCGFVDDVRRERVRRIGLLTGLKHDGGVYRLANFERGLVLDRLVEERRPRRVLELGTGRGLGCVAMAAAADRYGVDIDITTVDLEPSNAKQRWPIEIDGKLQVIEASRDEVWGDHVEAHWEERINQRSGTTAEVLRSLQREGATFDLVFIDAGHDIHSVVHDLVYASTLLSPDGAVLMDDYAPLDDYGIGTCIAVAHATRFFDDVETFRTEGMVYGDAVRPGAARGMALLSGPRLPIEVQAWKMRWWRLVAPILHRCYAPRYFPLKEVS